MKYLYMIVFLALNACGDSKPNQTIEGDYFDGLGTVNGEEVLFLFVSEFPADKSINVSFTTPTTAYTCRYFFNTETNSIRSYVSEPTDLAVVQIKNNELLFYSEPGLETNPCKKITSTRSFIRGE